MAAETIQNGDRVHDRDDPNPNDAIVVNQPPKAAGEWDVQSRDCTLADDNPDYPADAAVVVVCYEEALVEHGPPFDPAEQTELSLAALNEAGVNFYAFPAPRLSVRDSPATGLGDTTRAETDDEPPTTPTEATDDSEPASTSNATTETNATSPDTAQSPDGSDDADTSPSPDLQQLTATLEANGLTVEQTDEETLTVERLGQTYHIRPGEGIEGDGALRSQLETIVDDAI